MDEPEWLDEDVDAALEHIDYERSLCGGCGHPRNESFDIDHAFDYHAEPAKCHACGTRDLAVEAHSKKPNADTRGMYWTVDLIGG